MNKDIVTNEKLVEEINLKPKKQKLELYLVEKHQD